MTNGFHHVALGCKSFDRSVEFYSKVLGFKPAQNWGEPPKRAVLLDVGGGSFLELFERPDRPKCPCEPPCLCNPVVHFAFKCADVDAAIAAARGAGMEVTMEPTSLPLAGGKGKGGLDVRIAFFKGPDNELVEFFNANA